MLTDINEYRVDAETPEGRRSVHLNMTISVVV
jgi:hypothetical protein